MKKTLLYVLLLASSCQQDAAVAPDSSKAADEIEIVTQGRNRDCGVAQVLAIDSAQVRQVLGRSAFAPVYLALKLDTALWVRGSQTLPSESIVCTAMGPGYAPCVVDQRPPKAKRPLSQPKPGAATRPLSLGSVKLAGA